MTEGIHVSIQVGAVERMGCVGKERRRWGGGDLEEEEEDDGHRQIL